MSKAFYYSLVVCEDGQWSIQFGDFVRQVVSDEARDTYGQYRKKKIIKTGPSQKEIYDAVNVLNERY